MVAEPWLVEQGSSVGQESTPQTTTTSTNQEQRQRMQQVEDTNGIGKPATISGEKDDWCEWVLLLACMVRTCDLSWACVALQAADRASGWRIQVVVPFALALEP
eukprot:3148693-Amphidinium_carterae.1